MVQRSLGFLAIAALSAGSAIVGAEETRPVAAPVTQDAQATTPPAYAVEIGFEERIRSESLYDATDFDRSRDDDRRHTRFRTRLWGRLAITDRAELVVQINDESRKTTKPETAFKLDEVIFENAYVEYRFHPDLTFRVGRQNITRGEGVLIFDGGPLDGSRTQYFNAAVLTYRRKKASLDLIGISDPRTDTYLPVFNDKKKGLVEWDEKAFGLYYTGHSFSKTAIEAYYFHKREIGDTRPATGLQYQPDRRVDTIGGRVAHRLPAGFSLTGEMAYQWGRQNPGIDTRGFGGYAYVKKAFENRVKPTLLVGYVGLSGDDPSTATRENWDPLFSRWPKWSELYIYTLAQERGVAYWTNLGMWWAEMTMAPHKRVSARATYYHMSAFHSFPGNPMIYGSGTKRGDMVQARVDVSLNGSFRGHALYEGLFPGDYYRGTTAAHFIRVEIIYTFKKTWTAGR